MLPNDVNMPFGDFDDFDPSLELGDPTIIGDKVRLPFMTMNFWWNNGNIEAESGVRKFGGWAINENDYNEWLSQYTDLPTGLTGPHDWSGRLSKEQYRVWAVRHVWVIPVLRRSAWFLKRDGIAENKADWKSSTEWLCYSATVSIREKIVVPLGAMVLKAKSNSGLSLDAVFQEYKTKTAGIRTEISARIPAFRDNPNPQNRVIGSHLFYRPIGTFSQDKPHFKTVGKATKNDITPVENFFPAELTIDHMKLTLADSTARAIMVDMAMQSKEWADDWNLRGKKAKEERAAAQNMIETAQGLGGVYLGAPSDEIPF